MAQYFCLHEFFHHLAVSEKDFSHNYNPHQRFSRRYYLHTVFMVKEHVAAAGRPVD
jgi:hypothetical protein